MKEILMWTLGLLEIKKTKASLKIIFFQIIGKQEKNDRWALFMEKN